MPPLKPIASYSSPRQQLSLVQVSRMEMVDKTVALVLGTSCNLETSNLQQLESTKPSSHVSYFYNSHLDQHYLSNSAMNESRESTWHALGCGSHYVNSQMEYASLTTGHYADSNYYASEVDQNIDKQFYSSTTHLPEGGQYYHGSSCHQHYHPHQHYWHQPLAQLETLPGSHSLHYNYNYCDQAQAQQEYHHQHQYQQENDQKVKQAAYYQPAQSGCCCQQQQQHYVQENYSHTYHHQCQHQQSSSACYSGRQNSSQLTIAPPTYESDRRHTTDSGTRNRHAAELMSPSSNIDARLSHHQVHLQVWLSAGCEQQTIVSSNQESMVNDCPITKTTALATAATTASLVQEDTLPEIKTTQDDSYHLKASLVPPLEPTKVPPVSKVPNRISLRSKVSTSAKINQCPVCERNYARPSTLKTHLRTHTNERPFQCNICLKTFSQAANLTAHQRVHTGERPFSCPLCHRRFSQSSSVITHLRTHSGERPYRCGHCSRTFSDSSTLTKHCRIHSGEKPYQCDHCTLNFSQSGNLSRHMKLHLSRPNSANNSSSNSSSNSSTASAGAASSSRSSSARPSSTSRSEEKTIQI